MRKTKFALMQSMIALLLCFSMLIGTTFAWFTDEVISVSNIIQAGNLDAEMYWTDDLSTGTWYNAEKAGENTPFDYDLWEPGYTEVRYVKIVNAGKLALKYNLTLAPAGEVGKLAEVIDVYYAENVTANIADRTLSGMTKLGALLKAMNGAETAKGELLPGGETIVAVALHMDELAGNEYQGKSIGDGFVFKLLATQLAKEPDSFGPDYDENATFPVLKPGSITADISSKVQGSVLTEAVTMVSEDGAIAATVPAGTKVSGNSLILSVSELSATGSNITLQENEILRPMDVHIEGVAAENTAPILVTVKEAMMKGLNIGNYQLYHVEQSGVNTMTAGALDQHNGFTYDPATGDVTVALATFSEVTMVAEPAKWEGEFDYSWYDASKTELTIANADQLAAFGAIVGGMVGQTQDSFAGKTVKLIADINLGDDEVSNPSIIFYPIGYYNSEGTYERTNTAITSGLRIFEGTFDGNGHTVSNFYHNTWEMKGDHNWYSPEEQYYRDGMGLFGRVYKGTVKNLTVKNFSSDGEIATTGVIAAYADGATFENIAIFNCNPRVYNIGNGGIVGCVGWYAKEADLKTTFKNITVDNSNKISALWGSYDVACGGIVGQYYPTSGQTSAGTPKNGGVHFENCHISAQMDVYNDVCANYQYYAYRYTGMLIGSVRENVTIDGKSYPKMDGITASGCTVHFGDWNDYYYCEIIDNTTASYTHDYQMSRLTEIKAIDGTTITYLDGTTGTVPTSGRANYVIVDYTKGHGTENATCYHFKDGKVWSHEDGGKETINGVEVLKEDKQHIYLEFNNLVTGYGWGVTTKGVGDLAGVTILDREVANSVEKFKGKVTELSNNKEYKLGDIFSFVDNGVKLVPGALTVTVTNLDENNPVSATIVYDRNTWENSTITLTGTGRVQITIQDYYFCTPTTIMVNVNERQNEVKFENKFSNTDFVYRVGNADKSLVALGALFREIADVTDSKVTVTFANVAGSANGTYTANTTDWTGGTIQFSGTGRVKVVINDNDYCKNTELILEVVDAVNATAATSATKNNVVLLNDCGFSGLEVSGGYTLYGNGFTMTCASDAVAADLGYEFVKLDNGTLDNVQIVCPNFDYAALYKGNLDEMPSNRKTTDSSGKTRYYNARSGVMVTGNSQILNSRISGGRASVNVSSGNCVIDNSRIELGAVASLLVSAANSVTLRDVTLVQKPTASTIDSSKTIMGFSVLVMCDTAGNATPIALEGTLVQNAWADEADKQYVPSTGESFVKTALSKNDYLHDLDGDGVKESLNLGFAYMPESMGGKVNTPELTDNRTNKEAVPYDKVQVNSAYVYSFKYNDNETIPAEFKDTPNYVPNKYSDIITVSYSDTKEGLATGKSYGTGGWVYELNVDLDKASGYAIDFGKLSMLVNGVAVTEFKVNGNAKPTSPIAVTAGGTYYTLSADVNGKEYTVTYKVTGTETTKESPSLAASNYGAALLVGEAGSTLSKDTWHGAAPVLDGIQVKYWSVAEKQYKTITLSDYTPTSSGKQNGTNTTWTYTPDNGDFTLTITGGQVHSSNNVSAMPVVFSGKLYFVAASSKGLVNYGNTARTIPITYSFKDNNGGEVLTFKHTWSIECADKATAYDYSDFCKGTAKTFTIKSSNGNGCVTGDTLVTLADGTQKRIDEVTFEDQLLVWDFYSGEYAVKPASYLVNHGYGQNMVIKLKFADGTVIKVVNEHGFFDTNLNEFVIINDKNVMNYVGHQFAKEDGTTTVLVGCSAEEQYIEAYSILAAYHYNCYLDGMLSLTPPEASGNYFMPFEVGENMTFDAEKMKADIEKYGLFTYEEFAERVSKEVFYALNAPQIKVAIGKGIITMEEFEAIVNGLAEKDFGN